jgi:exoribonuclease R
VNFFFKFEFCYEIESIANLCSENKSKTRIAQNRSTTLCLCQIVQEKGIHNYGVIIDITETSFVVCIESMGIEQ